jgi:hypothetical protein
MLIEIERGVLRASLYQGSFDDVWEGKLCLEVGLEEDGFMFWRNLGNNKKI